MTCAMAESLLKAGIGFDSMLETVNAALMAKSGDESLATLDLTCIDLFTGEAEFRKAGAACTLVRRGRHAEVIEASSVPVGIMPGVTFACYRRQLAPGDVVVLVSDGVVATGHEWVLDLVRDWDAEEKPQHPGPAHHVGGQEAPQRRQGGRHHGPGPHPGVGGQLRRPPTRPAPRGAGRARAQAPFPGGERGPGRVFFPPGKKWAAASRNPSPPAPLLCRNAKTC